MNVEGEFQNCNIDIDCTVENDIDSGIDVNILDIGKPTNFTKLEIDNLENVEIEEIMNDDPEILNLKNNFFPKGLVPLEYLFDSNDVARKPKMEPLREDIEECNIGTKERPKFILRNRTEKRNVEETLLETFLNKKRHLLSNHD